MFARRPTRRGSLDIAAYATTVVLLSGLAWWCTRIVGTVLLSVIDAHVLDGSGQVEARHSAGSPAGLSAIAADERQAPPAAPAAQRDGGITSATVAATAARSGQIIPTVIQSESDPVANYHDGEEGTFRTYCVRLCDGYFWPISFSTTDEHFERDAARCEASCGSPARLFVHPTPGGDPISMTSLSGAPYKSLKTAFRFRTTYDSQCKCKANPWEQQAKDTHRLYAAAEAARKGDAKAAANVRTLSRTIAQAEKAAAAEKTVALRAADAELKKMAVAAGSQPLKFGSGRGRNSGNANRLASVDQKPRRYIARPPSVMRLGAMQPESRSNGGWRPASGSRRNWQDRAFSGN